MAPVQAMTGVAILFRRMGEGRVAVGADTTGAGFMDKGWTHDSAALLRLQCRCALWDICRAEGDAHACRRGFAGSTKYAVA